jgi:uncharacterized SAM-binding protein YcdF (DUF218 family)
MTLSTTGPGQREGAAMPRPLKRAGAVFGLLVYLVGLVALLAGLGFAAGFFYFASTVAEREPALTRNADGIVVLTGGASRIADGMELLSQKRGQRLLITGVHKANSPQDLARQLPAHDNLFACCVDLGYEALNTLGNAHEARRWAENRKLGSLIVVTSNYHMPRALMEFQRQMPAVEMIPFPVISEQLAMSPWWTSTEGIKLLFFEYVKYTVARLRIQLEDMPAGSAQTVQAHAG